MNERTILVADRLRNALQAARRRGERQYSIARAAGLHPSTVSSLVHNMVPVRADDARVLRLGAVLGVKPDECFVVEEREPVAV